MNLRGYMFVYEHTATGQVARLRTGVSRTAAYVMETEVHVYGFSIAANVLLSFIPFLIVMVSLARTWFGRPAEEAVYLALRDYLPDFMGRNVGLEIRKLVNERGALQLTSVALLFFTANGIFEPLEVALNKAFGIAKNRSFLRNQLVSMGLVFGCGGLMLLSTTLAAFNQQWMRELFGQTDLLSTLMIKTIALPATILALFLTYWILPNGPVPVGRVLKAAIGVGIVLEFFKYLIMLTWPFLYAKLRHEYGLFYASVSIILWSFFGSMIVLAGAEWAGRETIDLAYEETTPNPGAVLGQALGSVTLQEQQDPHVDGKGNSGGE